MGNLMLYDKMVEQNALEAVKQIGLTFAKSGMFGITTEAQGQVAAMTCMMEGMTLVEFGKTYHVIEGKLSMRADAMQAKFQESGGRIQWICSDAKVCEATFFHKDYAPDGVTLKVTLQELVDSGVTKDKYGPIKSVYQKHPRQMLRARIISEGVRMVNPSIVAGCYTPEEVSDFESSPTVKRNGGRANKEPKEADAVVVDDAPPPETDIEMDLSDIEDDANAYLESIGWITAGQTWRDLVPAHRVRIANAMVSFREKATRKETVNA